MRHATFVIPASIFAVTSLAPVAAAACWDGVRIETDRISIMIGDADGGDLEWPDADLDRAADWLVAIEAILPPGDELHVEFGLVYFGDDSTCAAIEEANSFAELFAKVGHACGRSADELARARARSASLFSVQILSTSNRAAAEARKAELDLDCHWHGVYERGGFPSLNPCAEVESATLVDGREVHRVLVGNFLSRASAEQARASIREELGVDGMVRLVR